MKELLKSGKRWQSYYMTHILRSHMVSPVHNWFRSKNRFLKWRPASIKNKTREFDNTWNFTEWAKVSDRFEEPRKSKQLLCTDLTLE